MNSLSAQQLILGTGILSLSGNSLFINGSNPINGTTSSTISYVSGNFAISLNSGLVYMVNTLLSSGISGTGALITGTFPTASGLMGYTFIVKDYAGNALNNPITLTGTSNQTFDSNLNIIINQNYLSFNVISNGTNWNII